MKPDVFVVDAVRTPRAKKKGKFSNIHPVDLLTYPLKALVERNSIEPSAIEDVITGCVTQVKEQSWCIGRAAVLACGWPIEIPGTTVNRLCASSLQALNFGSSIIKAENAELLIAAGIEHMTRVPMLSDSGGEESALIKQFHPNLVHQGLAAERIAKKWNFSRTEVDEFALRSQKNASAAFEKHSFVKSLIPVPYKAESGESLELAYDDNPRPETTIEGLASLKLAFQEDGVLTAGNSSAIVDGASAVLLASENAVKKYSLRVRARVVGQAVVGSDPDLMLTGPIAASRKLLSNAGLTVKDIDLWEINEAFAPIPMITIKELEIDPKIVNVNGGAISLGHPLGATGTILVGTLLDELEKRGKRYGVVTMCIGLGMGVSTLIERI